MNNTELKFLRGSIDNFNSLTKNDNYFYLVENLNNIELYLGDNLIAKSSTPSDLLDEINRAIAKETSLQEQINLLVGGDIDMSSYYTKSEVDDLLENIDTDVDLSDYYTKSQTYSQSEVNALIDGVNSGDVDLTNYYTKDETYSQSEIDEMIEDNNTLKLHSYIFNASGTYTKTELEDLFGCDINTMIRNIKLGNPLIAQSNDETTANVSFLVETNYVLDNSGNLKSLTLYWHQYELFNLMYVTLNSDGTYNITKETSSNGVSIDLSNFYTKDETYSQSEVDNLINNIPSNEIDLSGYYTKTEVDDLITKVLNTPT